jgi:alkylation response protein AidB-like acyl-CoA dehydrogenase
MNAPTPPTAGPLTFGFNPHDDMNDLRMSEKATPLYEHVKRFIAETVVPMQKEFQALGEGHTDRWTFAPGQLDVLEKAKDQAKKEGLWNFFLPDADTGEGLSNLDYAYIAVELGKAPMASEVMNCSAPDTGNMEVLERVGTPEQKERWLKPLLNGEIRSAYAMTEPAVASSDAKNIATQAVLDGDEWVINGEKYYISGAGDPRCKIMITMVRTNPDAPPHKQQSQILVPIDAPGVEILGPMHVFGEDHAPRGHMHIRFTNVRVPKSNVLLGEGRGFEISQVRLGPGRIHHCMRTIGKAARGLRPQDRLAGRQRRDHLSRPDRHRGHAPDGAEGRPGHGRARQPRSPGLGVHGQGHGAGAGLQDHRPGHPDARRHGHFPVDAPGLHVHRRAPPALCRRPGRGPPPGGRPQRAAGLRGRRRGGLRLGRLAELTGPGVSRGSWPGSPRTGPARSRREG